MREISSYIPKSKSKRLALYLAGWTVIALISAVSFWLWRDVGGQGKLWTTPMLILGKLIVWYIWAFLTLLILWLGRKISFKREHAVRWFLTHLALSALISVVYMCMYSAAMIIMRDIPWKWDLFAQMYGILASWHQSFYFLAYWLIIGIDHAVKYYQNARAKELEAADLERRLAQAQFEALRSQLHPHFLFNTLHTISGLMHSDVKAADRMLTRLSDLLRMALRSSSNQECTLNDELEFIRVYLEIQNARYRDRLTVEYDIPSDLYDARTPTLLLQPIVENAFEHGVSTHSEPALIRIAASRNNGSLVIAVENSGPEGTPEKLEDVRDGIGLGNTRERLQKLYAESQSLELTRRHSGGAVTRITIPYHTN